MCGHNLKQLVIAFTAYHDDYKKFPPGAYAPPGSHVPNAAGTNFTWQPGWREPNSTCCPWGIFGWPALILPYVEGQSIQRAINFNVPAYSDSIPEDPALSTWAPPSGERGPAVDPLPAQFGGGTNPNIIPSRLMPKIFVCPSVPRVKREDRFKDYAIAYDNNPAGENCCPERRPVGSRGPFTGMGWVNSEVKIRDVIDGTSHTFLIMEKAHDINASWCSQNMGCNQFFWVHHQSQGFVYGTRPPNDTLPNTRAAGGPHPLGLNASFVDGHVSFIKNSIDMATYRALFSRAQQEPISDQTQY